MTNSRFLRSSYGTAAVPGRQRGFVLVAFTLALLLILGSVGLAFDVGRMYITRNELLSFCDAAAIAAVAKLDGTTTGMNAARNAARATIKGFQFGTTPIDDTNATITIEFAPNPATPTSAIAWAANPSPAGIILARVTARVSIPMSIMPVVTGVFNSSIAASAAAKQVPTGKLKSPFPFTPYWMPEGFGLPTKDADGNPIVDADGNPVTNGDPFGMVPARVGTDPEFTYQQGGIYSLRGPSSINLDKSMSDPTNPNRNQMCQNDATDAAALYRKTNGQPDRGYISWDQGKNDITQTILGNNIAPSGLSIEVGDSVVSSCDYCLVTGTAATEVHAIQDRIGMDTTAAQQAVNYKEYVETYDGGNGARVVVVPISTGPCGTGTLPPCPEYPESSEMTGTAGPNTVLGFAAFFLLKADQYQTAGAVPICAEYIGAWTPNHSGAALPGEVTLPMLVE